MPRIIASVVVAVLVTTACVATIQPAVNVTYQDAERPVITRLAILPVTAGEGLEGFRRMTADSLSAAVRAQRSDVHLVPAEEALRLLNDAGLADRYSDMIISYNQTGILSKETLQTMGTALNAGHMLHVKVAYASLQPDEYTTLQNLDMFAHLWDSAKGDVVWESTGGAQVNAGIFVQARTIPEILAIACVEVIKALP